MNSHPLPVQWPSGSGTATRFAETGFDSLMSLLFSSYNGGSRPANMDKTIDPLPFLTNDVYSVSQ